MKRFFTSVFTILTLLFLPLYLVHANSTPPETTHTFTPSSPTGNNNWYTQAVTIQLVATDLESGVASINYKVDDNEWQQEEFLGTLNLIENPSFEIGNYWWISKWHHPNYPWWKASLRQSFWEYRFGNRSAQIFTYSNGWYYWTNENYYAVTEPFKVYSVTAWVKTLDFWGTGAYYKVWAKKSGGADLLLVESDHVSGSTDWQPLETSFYMPAGYEGVYLQLGGAGIGFVWWDGVSLHEETEATYEFTVASDGVHNLWYYSIDRAEPPNTEETKGPFEFKIDATIPTNWRDFETSQEPGYNDHTFDISITVSDYTSGVDINTGFYSYSTNGGETWSDWVPVDEYNPSQDGSQDVTLTAKEVDLVNSNWHITKMVQFKISDMAGLTSLSPLFTINSPWLKTTLGDVYAQAGISLSAATPEPNVTGITVSSGSIEGVSSSNDWFISNYSVLDRNLYDEWLPLYEEPIPLSDVGDKLPTESGIYITDETFVIRNSTIPGNLDNIQNLAAVVFVEGDLIIDNDLELHETSGILFIVSGALAIKHNVERVDSAFFVDGEVDTNYNEAPSSQLVINGFIVADSFTFKRTLKHTENQETPAETINYEPKYLLLLQAVFGEAFYSYSEITP